MKYPQKFSLLAMTAGLILLSAPAVADAVVTAMEPPFETAASNQSA